ncbi:O-methyltransferase [Diplogelasinospora grovesii]|uniref:O-methyltransferase n=1 Tax=Diplogelasinospora grovesii TaxID=303347 RepID=A0AAN6S3U8_9PEZI|nr:O-methyltransferase [Diplogelasinospora grovesii]
MGKFKLGSLFGSSSSTKTQDASDKKKEHRKSFAGFASASAFKNKNGGSNGNGVKPALPAVAETAPTEAQKVNGEQTSRMVALAKKITNDTEKLEAYMKEHNLAMPSFDVDSPGDFPKLPEDIKQCREEIKFATKELGLLAQGPRESLRWGTWDFLEVLALQMINHFGIAKLFPADATITLAELQTKTKLDAINLARLLRMAMTNGIFREPSPGVIAHTAASRLLAEDEALQAWIGFNCEDIFPAAAHVIDAIKTYPEATSLVQTGFCFAFGTVSKEPMFVTFGKDPERARRMGRAMVSLTGGEGYEVSYLVDVEGGGYDFSEIDAAGGTLVDIGGSHGFVCVELAARYKRMKFVVQDLQKTVDSAPKPICDDPQAAERITLVAHDFFTEQVTKDADVYFFRWIMHNYSTPYAIKILWNLIPALKPGARILINDHCLGEPGSENAWDESVMRRMDLVMLALLNAQERTEAEFRELFKAASPGFVFKGVTRPKGCRMSIVEAVWQPESLAAEAAVTADAVDEVKVNGDVVGGDAVAVNGAVVNGDAVNETAAADESDEVKGDSTKGDVDNE